MQTAHVVVQVDGRYRHSIARLDGVYLAIGCDGLGDLEILPAMSLTESMVQLDLLK